MQTIYSLGSDARFNIYRRIPGIPLDKNKHLVSRIHLEENSLLIPGCFSQREDLVHAVNNKGPRISIQFRTFVKPNGGVNIHKASPLCPHSKFLVPK